MNRYPARTLSCFWAFPPLHLRTLTRTNRYDVRLLLDQLPSASSRTPAPAPTRADSPGGWSDLPSDSEDMFFLSPSEVEDYRREKRRKLIENYREERVRARRAEDGDEDEAEDEAWGGSDEEVRMTVFIAIIYLIMIV